MVRETMKYLFENWRRFLKEEKYKFPHFKHQKRTSKYYASPKIDWIKPIKLVVYHHGMAVGQQAGTLLKTKSFPTDNQTIVVMPSLGSNPQREAMKGGYIDSVVKSLKKRAGQEVSIDSIDAYGWSAGGKSISNWLRAEMKDANFKNMYQDKLKSVTFLDAAYWNRKFLEPVIAAVGQENIRFITGPKGGKSKVKGISRTTLNARKYKETYPNITHHETDWGHGKLGKILDYERWKSSNAPDVAPPPDEQNQRDIDAANKYSSDLASIMPATAKVAQRYIKEPKVAYDLAQSHASEYADLEAVGPQEDTDETGL